MGARAAGGSWRIWTTLRSPLFPATKTQTRPSSPPKNTCRSESTGYIIIIRCFSWRVHVTEQITTASVRGWVFHAVEGKPQFFYDLTNSSYGFFRFSSPPSRETQFSNLGPNCARAPKGHGSIIPLHRLSFFLLT